jgi:hypothetical protein
MNETEYCNNCFQTFRRDNLTDEESISMKTPSMESVTGESHWWHLGNKFVMV